MTLNTGAMVITKNVTIDGPGANLLTIDAKNSSRHFTVDDGLATATTVTFEGMTLTKGQTSGTGSANGGGSIYISNESVTLDGMELRFNTSSALRRRHHGTRQR